MKSIKLSYLFVLSSMFLLTSCFTTKAIYDGNVHESAIGKTKNQILRMYGVPDREATDGEGGSILIYEKHYQTTSSQAIAGTNSGAYGESYSNSYGSVAGAVGKSVSSARGFSRTTTDKEYLNIFLNKKGVVYDYKSNYGNKFKYEQEFDMTSTFWVTASTAATVGFLYWLSTLFPSKQE